MKKMHDQAVKLLEKLINTPSFNGEEDMVTNLVVGCLKTDSLITMRKFNNVWCYNRYFDLRKPTILLNSYLDTVKPNSQYTHDSFVATIKDGKFFGLGSNDGGGALVSLISTFLHFYEREDLLFNLCLAVTAEEENSGKRGIRCIVDDLVPIDFAIVGEPTGMHMELINPSMISLEHPIVRVGGALGRECYVSPMNSDQGWIAVPSIKIGPGDSARSHSADEFIYLKEIEEGIDIYVHLLESLKPYYQQLFSLKLQGYD